MDHRARIAQAVLRASRMLAAVARTVVIFQLIAVVALAPLAAPMHSATMPVNGSHTGSCLSCLTVTIGPSQHEIRAKPDPAPQVKALVPVDNAARTTDAWIHETCTVAASGASSAAFAPGPSAGDKRPGLFRRAQMLLEESLVWVGQCLRSCNDSIDACADRLAAVMDSDSAMAGWRHTNKSKAFGPAGAKPPQPQSQSSSQSSSQSQSQSSSQSSQSSNMMRPLGASAGKGPGDAPTAAPAPSTSEILRGLFAVSLIGSGMALILQIS